MTELDKLESIFFDVLNDLKNYLSDLTLVGGWIPYIYAKFLWNNLTAKLITTTDIDFGFGESKTEVYPKTIFQMLSPLDYTERHPRMDRIYPVVLYKKGKIRIDFITFPEVSPDAIEKFIGRQININKIENFDFLLKYRIPVNIHDKSKKTLIQFTALNHRRFSIIKGQLLSTEKINRRNLRICTTYILY